MGMFELTFSGRREFVGSVTQDMVGGSHYIDVDPFSLTIR